MEQNNEEFGGERREGSKQLLAVSILVASVIIGGSLIYSSGRKAIGPNELAQVAGEGASRTSDALKNLPDDDVILGDPEAPVTFVSFGDFQCPFCGKMFQEVEGKIREEYVKTGKLRFIYRDFPIDSLHPFARAAAEAAECARDAGKYFAYHDALFSRQAQIPTMDFAVLADEIGIDGVAFRACVAEEKYKDEVEADYQDGIAAGVTGTPATFINGKLFLGALPYETFKQAIEAALAEPGR